MTRRITLRDLDNRDADGAQYEFTGTTVRVISYLHGPVRGDIHTPESTARLDEAIAAIRAGDITTANEHLTALSIRLEEQTS